VVQWRLYKAGIRLAWMLNGVFPKHETSGYKDGSGDGRKNEGDHGDGRWGRPTEALMGVLR
jgi:hypothetical protein